MKWEYRVERLGPDSEVLMSRLGGQGWELIAVVVQFTTHFGYFKRRTYEQ